MTWLSYWATCKVHLGLRSRNSNHHVVSHKYSTICYNVGANSIYLIPYRVCMSPMIIGTVRDLGIGHC